VRAGRGDGRSDRRKRPGPGEDRTRTFHVGTREKIKPKTEDDLFRLIEESDAPAFILILDSVQDPHNLGACLRSADAAGVLAVVAPKDRSAAITEAVRRISTGGADNVPFVQVTNLARTMAQLKEAGLWLVGTADRAEKSIYDLDLTGPIAIVMGNEGEGLRRLTMESCDHLVQIPMHGHVDCLNVSVATGVCLFEALRQRQYRK
jgi:23S rRNA (guanosine2251-2'-O)-methyltransferase